MITLDVSTHITVVVCSCGWRDDRPTRAQANRLAAAHASQIHSRGDLASAHNRRARRIEDPPNTRRAD